MLIKAWKTKALADCYVDCHDGRSWIGHGLVRRAGINNLRHLQEVCNRHHICYIVYAKAQFGCVHEVQDQTQT